MKKDHFEHQPVPSRATTSHEEKILRRLFHGYPGGLAERRGFCEGGELDDWLAAEAEVGQQLQDQAGS